MVETPDQRKSHHNDTCPQMLVSTLHSGLQNLPCPLVYVVQVYNTFSKKPRFVSDITDEKEKAVSILSNNVY